MYSKILVPLDGSKLSECVLEHVKAIATGCHAQEVVLLRVIEPMSTHIYEIPEDWMRDITKKVTADAKGYLARVSDDLSKAGLAVKTEVMDGIPAEVILDYAKKKKAELIMMSTKGESGLTRWIFGSVADKVVRQSSAPVFVVSPPGCAPESSR